MANGWATGIGMALDHGGDVPLGVQLDWGIRAAVASGRLQPGERLPALRQLAADLGVNHNTLRAAVAKLEAEGLLESRHGTGTFVAPDAAAHGRHAALVEQAVRWAADAGLSPRDLASALYVLDPPEVAAPDAATEERRALRDDIAALDRMVIDLEDQLPGRLPVEPAPARRGARLLTTDDLREQRDALVRRLAAVRQALDEVERAEAEPEAQPKEAAQPQRAVRPGRAPRPGISPA